MLFGNWLITVRITLCSLLSDRKPAAIQVIMASTHPLPPETKDCPGQTAIGLYHLGLDLPEIVFPER